MDANFIREHNRDVPLVTSAVDLKVPADGVVLAHEHLGPVSLLLPLMDQLARCYH